ncbi:MAG TPA: YbhB/YbcL family Raf kinase inhibitor-like protein [Baekduia sp.]|nr:YbhB/YbcL family Raf kinase inhibitor-like protein [Baekduia sp.]
MAQRFFVDKLQISSTAFGPGERIPDRHTGNGEDISPPLTWSGAPEGTRSFAIVVHDPDAPLVDGWAHWVVYNLGPGVTGLSEGEHAPTEGENGAGNTGYNGPAPPPGHGTHRYYFWVYALASEPDLAPGLTRAELLAEIEEDVLEQARYVGTYDNAG